MNVIAGWILTGLPFVHSVLSAILGPQAETALNNIEAGLPQVISGVTALSLIVGAKLLRNSDPKKVEKK